MDIVNFYKVPLENLIVIYDDIDLPVGKVSVLVLVAAQVLIMECDNIIYLLNKQDFPRIRIGVGKQPEYMDLADYVMTKFSKDELPLIEEAIKKATHTVEEIIKKWYKFCYE